MDQTNVLNTRRSDRVPGELPVVISGVDASGFAFLEQSTTVVVSRHGAKIVLSRKLVPDQELNIRCLKTGRESDARVVGQTGVEGGRSFYGIELLDDEADLWGIEFPEVSEAARAVGRVLLECLRCRHVELVYLDEFEVEVLEASQYLSRHCPRCSDQTLWKRSASKEPPAEEAAKAPAVQPPAPGTGRRTRNDRKHVRLDLKVEVCLRHPQLGEEIGMTENVSRGGFRFHSRKKYAPGSILEAALPYSSGAANIFAPCQIVYAGDVPGTDLHVYGVQYLAQGQSKRTPG